MGEKSGTERKAGPTPAPPPVRKETPPTVRGNAVPPQMLSSAFRSGRGAAGWGQGEGAGAFLLRAEEGEVGEEGEAEEALTTLRL